MTAQAKKLDQMTPLEAEAARIEEIKARATPPEAMAAAPVAPARGPQVLIREYTVARGGIPRAVGAHWREADVFDRMDRAARVAHDRRGGDAPFVPPFTPGQIAMAGRYRALVERRAAGAVKCSSAEGRTGGGGGMGWMDGYMQIGRELDMIRARIGTGEAMDLRRVRPSKRGARVAITDRALVDMVCLDRLTLSEVLHEHGWSKDVAMIARLRTALAAALDRMQGYR